MERKIFSAALALTLSLSFCDPVFAGQKVTGNLEVTGTVQIRGGTPAAGKVLTSSNDTGTATWETVTIPAGTNKRTITATIDGNYAAPEVDAGDCVRPAYSGTITGWYIDSKVSGSIVVDVKKNGSSIAGTEKPTLSSATSNSDSNLTTWTTSLTGGDQICFEVDSASTLTKANVALTVEATT